MFLLSFISCTVFYIVVCCLQASSTSVFDHDELVGDDADYDDEGDAAVVIYCNT